MREDYHEEFIYLFPEEFENSLPDFPWKYLRLFSKSLNKLLEENKHGAQEEYINKLQKIISKDIDALRTLIKKGIKRNKTYNLLKSVSFNS